MDKREEERSEQAQINDIKQGKPSKEAIKGEHEKTKDDSEHEDYYADPEDVSLNFNKVQEAIVDYDNSQIKIEYEDAIRILKKLEHSIIYHGMFSPNEDFSEVATENIKYMLIPYYLADVFGRMSKNRKVNLHFSKVYFDEFIKLCNHYGLLSKEQRKKWKEIFDNPNYEPTREEKIGQYKDKKSMETKIKELETYKDEDKQREVMTLILNTKMIKAFEDIRMINLEFQMHEHKEKLEREKQENPNKKEEVKPVPKMKVWQVEKPQLNQNGQELPRMVSAGQKASLCHQHMHEIRQNLNEQVFKTGGTQPTVTLEEFAELEMKRAKEQERLMKQAADERALENDNSSDEEVNIKKTLKERAWDDWKDLHDKGEGNRNLGR